MAWIAIDAGTTVIKAVAFGNDGRELAIARENTVLLHPQPGYSEQSMEDVWQAVVSTVRQVARQCDEPIEGVVSTAQGDGCWLVDAAGKSVRDAILWNDGRASEIIESWREGGVLERAFRISGSVSYPGLPNAIAAWLGKYEPRSLTSARWLLTCNGWIFSRMTGCLISDLSDASNPFSDISAGRYSSALLRCFGLEELEEKLPPIAKADELSAALLPSAAERMNLPSGIPVVMAPYDIVTTAFGCGVSLAGQACVILGTTICAETITRYPDLAGTPSGTTIALGGEQYLRAMPTLTGCEAQEWAAKILAQDDLEGLSSLAGQSMASMQAPFFLPYLSSAGERAPFLAPDARGSFHNLSFSTTSSQIAHAVYEGLSFVIRECLQAAADQAVQEVRVSGGGARSDLWCQMIANVTGIRVIRSSGSEHGARGAFLFALATTKQIENMTEGIRRFLDKEHVFIPQSGVHDIYLNRYELWRALREPASRQWALLRGNH
jgi:xylulokinase